MKQFRYGLFETNSSSCHSLVVRPKQPAFFPEIVYVSEPGYYGWEVQEASPLCYFWAMICSDDDKNILIEEFFSILRKNDIKVVLRDDPDAYSNCCFIDHYDGTITRYLLARPELLLRFLFNNESYVLCGNDNDGYSGPGTLDFYIAADYDLGGQDKDGVTYFYKGN